MLEMPYFLHLRLLVPSSPLNCVPNALWRPPFVYMVDGANLQSTISRSRYISSMKIRSHSFILNSFSRFQSAGTLQLRANVGESTQITFKSQMSVCWSWNHIIDGESRVDYASEYMEDLDMEGNKETERRRKIGLANKGKAPWNKGKKHSAETRELIRLRTIEALKDPKVRKKMSEAHHAHSEEIKAKIGLGQKRVWQKRLKLRNIKEKLYHTWAQTIAEAAKIGWHDHEELEWDSYDKLIAEMTLQQIQLAADKKSVKANAKLRAAREKSERMARRALQKRKKEEKAKSRGQVKRRTRRKPKDEQEKLPISIGFKLKARITKIRQMKPVEGQVAGDAISSHQPAIKNIDLEFIKREKLRRELSLADQIKAAKKKRAESSTREVLTRTTSNLLTDDRVEQLASAVYKSGP